MGVRCLVLSLIGFGLIISNPRSRYYAQVSLSLVPGSKFLEFRVGRVLKLLPNERHERTLFDVCSTGV
jgi:hypothetical protein